MKNKVRNLDLIIILASITVLALITGIILWTRPYEVKSIEDIHEVSIKNYKTMNKNKDEYFVLLWDSEKETDQRLEECVLAYAEYSRNHKDAPKIYVIDYNDDKNITNSSNFNIAAGNLETQVPCLATVSTSGSLTNQKKTIPDICNLLEDYMNGRK